MHLRGRGTVRLGGSLTSEALELEIQESGVQRAGTRHFTCNCCALIVPPQNTFPNLGVEPGHRHLRDCRARRPDSCQDWIIEPVDQPNKSHLEALGLSTCDSDIFGSVSHQWASALPF